MSTSNTERSLDRLLKYGVMFRSNKIDSINGFTYKFDYYFMDGDVYLVKCKDYQIVEVVNLNRTGEMWSIRKQALKKYND